MTEKATYSTKNMTSYQGLNGVRKRQGMYIGGNDSKALLHLVWEILDNAIDEAAAGFGDAIEVAVRPSSPADAGFGDFFVQIIDHGRGIPVDVYKGKTAVLMAFTELHSGGKFDDKAYAAAGGLNGVGAAVVNALSSRMDVTVHQSGKKHSLSFNKGIPGHFDSKGQFTKSTALKVEKLPADRKTSTGTCVRFWPDMAYFQDGTTLDSLAIKQRCKDKTYLLPGVTFTVSDDREEQHWTESFVSENGLPDLVQVLAEKPLIADPITCVGEYQYVERVPVMDPDTGVTTPTDTDRVMRVDVAFMWDPGYDGRTEAYVNKVHTPAGGRHVAGFETALTTVVNAQLQSQRMLKSTGTKVDKADVLEGLYAAVSVYIQEPHFEGQTKEKLGTAQASAAVNKIVSEQLESFFTARATKASGKVILTKILAAQTARLDAKSRRDAVRKKNAIEASLPTKLKDCRQHDLDTSEIFLIEGDSAAGTAVLARDSKTQAVLPLRGKVLNVVKAPSEKKMLANAECASMISAFGCGFGPHFDLTGLRYGKIIIMTDADFDGYHIRSLLLGFLYTYMPGLLKAGHVYAAVPPLFQLRYKVGKKLESKFALDDTELQKVLTELAAEGVSRDKVTVTRMKGLGEADAPVLRETTMGSGRTLKLIRMDDAMKAAAAIHSTLGPDSGPRKKMIEDRLTTMSATEVMA